MKVHTLKNKQHFQSRKITQIGFFAILFNQANTIYAPINHVRMDLTKQINLLNEIDVIAEE
jgi:hypothetical protein